ncbi:MAG: hypothetical protein HKN76_12010 [Saprospiraceae bacterium]|nr:hypothetical protein [Saprospiraceae bacterium]
MTYKLFGIRHHGAGSCRNLVSALHSYAPEIVLIECPADAESLITYVAHELVKPPVAIMIYNPKDLSQYAYYPFTVFSPEWQAIQYGVEKSIPVWFFDLPQSQSFLISDHSTVTKKEQGFTHDPFGQMAKLAGFEDPERWWEEYIEQQKAAPEIFDTILDLMQELRKSDITDKRSNLIREAFMRQKIRAAIKSGYQKIAVVCGAWHAPVLTDLSSPGASDDAKILRGLKRTTAAYTWVPWSYNRIARHTGYGSGVISPYWYEALFADHATAVARWMSRASAFLSELGHQVSPAQTIESTRLAVNLAYLRKKAMPGIVELFDAVIAVHVQGNDQILEKLRLRLLEGEKIGTVSDQVPTVPLLKDIETHLKKTRLFKDWKKDGLIEKHFDLRKSTQLEASRLLRRMQLLGISWAQEKEVEHNPLGTFHEYWDLQWFPEFELQIIEASMWGNTLEDASVHYITHQLADDIAFEKLGTLLYQALHANLPGLVPGISKKISDLGNLTDDVLSLMLVMPPLIWSLRYGNVAQYDMNGLHQLIDQLFPRICILIPGKTTNLSEELALESFKSINQLHQALQLLENPKYLLDWTTTLIQIANIREANPLIKGNCLRLLLIRESLDESAIYKLVRFNLSSLLDPFYPSLFLEGLLYGGGWLLIQKPALRKIIDQWILPLTEEQFITFLPILRRTFSSFSVEEKEALYNLLFAGRFVEEKDVNVNDQRKELVLPTLRFLLK